MLWIATSSLSEPAPRSLRFDAKERPGARRWKVPAENDQTIRLRSFGEREAALLCLLRVRIVRRVELWILELRGVVSRIARDDGANAPIEHED